MEHNNNSESNFNKKKILVISSPKLYRISGMTQLGSCLGEGDAAKINIQTEIVNGERGHYLVWSVRVKG